VLKAAEREHKGSQKQETQSGVSVAAIQMKLMKVTSTSENRIV
jgi:hypothetical protein